jgi:hypothetical protein
MKRPLRKGALQGECSFTLHIPYKGVQKAEAAFRAGGGLRFQAGFCTVRMCYSVDSLNVAAHL